MTKPNRRLTCAAHHSFVFFALVSYRRRSSDLARRMEIHTILNAALLFCSVPVHLSPHLYPVLPLMSASLFASSPSACGLLPFCSFWGSSEGFFSWVRGRRPPTFPSSTTTYTHSHMHSRQKHYVQYTPQVHTVVIHCESDLFFFLFLFLGFW